MNFSSEITEHYAIVKIEADKLGGVISPELKTAFVDMNAKGIKNIVVDMTNARYCDSSGLSSLLVGNRLSKDADGTFVMCGLAEMVQKLIGISQLESVLAITPTLQEAVDYVMMEEVGRQVDNE